MTPMSCPAWKSIARLLNETVPLFLCRASLTGGSVFILSGEWITDTFALLLPRQKNTTARGMNPRSERPPPCRKFPENYLLSSRRQKRITLSG
jgi:hypothetical protein